MATVGWLPSSTFNTFATGGLRLGAGRFLVTVEVEGAAQVEAAAVMVVIDCSGGEASVTVMIVLLLSTADGIGVEETAVGTTTFAEERSIILASLDGCDETAVGTMTFAEEQAIILAGVDGTADTNGGEVDETTAT